MCFAAESDEVDQVRVPFHQVIDPVAHLNSLSHVISSQFISDSDSFEYRFVCLVKMDQTDVVLMASFWEYHRLDFLRLCDTEFRAHSMLNSLLVIETSLSI